MSSKNNSGIIALLAGTAIGLGLGILFAPDKGSKTRDKIIDGLDVLKEGAKTKWNDFETDAKEKVSKTKEDLKETLDELLSDSSYKAEEAISFLEEKLAELKKANAKLHK
jgi:gas vesicle protein